MPATKSIVPQKNWMTAINEDRGAGLRHDIVIPFPTIPTAAGTVDLYTMAPEDGYLHSIEFSGMDALVASDTNYVTFSATNLGQAGTGTTQLLSSGPENSTKVTGGSAVVANGRKALALVTTATPLKVLAGDRIRVRATVTGTLPNTVTNGIMVIRFNP